MVNARKIALMHEKYGWDEEHTCGECQNLITGYTWGGKRLRKCLVYGVTQSNASDWAKSYTACGMFNVAPDESGRRVIDEVQHKAERREIDGQTSFGDDRLRSWIPCRDRLPEEYVPVLVCRSFEGGLFTCVGWRTFDHQWCVLDPEHDGPKGNGVKTKAVDYWMPMPEPPDTGR